MALLSLGRLGLGQELGKTRSGNVWVSLGPGQPTPLLTVNKLPGTWGKGMNMSLSLSVTQHSWSLARKDLRAIPSISSPVDIPLSTSSLPPPQLSTPCPTSPHTSPWAGALMTAGKAEKAGASPHLGPLPLYPKAGGWESQSIYLICFLL